MLSPHGTGTSAASGRVYHFLTGTGQIAIFEIDADVPTVKLLQTRGDRRCIGQGSAGRSFHGGAATWPARTASKSRWSNLSDRPTCRDRRHGGEGCGATASFLRPANVPTPIAGKPEERAALQYAMPSPDGKTVFIEIGTLYGPPNVTAESRFVAVVDLSDPYRPDPAAFHCRRGGRRHQGPRAYGRRQAAAGAQPGGQFGFRDRHRLASSRPQFPYGHEATSRRHLWRWNRSVKAGGPSHRRGKITLQALHTALSVRSFR